MECVGTSTKVLVGGEPQAPSSSDTGVPFQYSQFECSGAASTTQGFTYGEVVNSVWLFLIFLVLAYGFLYNSLKRQRVNLRK